MFIVKKRSEILRFGLFLVLVGALVWFVMGRASLWRLSARPTERAVPTGSPLVTATPVGATANTAGTAANPGGKAAKPGAQPATPAQPATGASGLDLLADGRDYFAEYRIDRERTRGALGERLKELMDSASAPEYARQQATEQYLKLSQTAALESQAEALVKARGFDDVIVHLAEGSAQVVVRAAQISQQQFLQVVDTVSRVTGVKSSAITVLAKYQ